MVTVYHNVMIYRNSPRPTTDIQIKRNPRETNPAWIRWRGEDGRL